MAYVTVPEEYDFSTRFPTWIIAYCPDTDSWFCTNQRFFYYEYPKEFQCESEAVAYFNEHSDEFIVLTKEMSPSWDVFGAFLENTGKWYV